MFGVSKGELGLLCSKEHSRTIVAKTDSKMGILTAGKVEHLAKFDTKGLAILQVGVALLFRKLCPVKSKKCLCSVICVCASALPAKSLLMLPYLNSSPASSSQFVGSWTGRLPERWGSVCQFPLANSPGGQ